MEIALIYLSASLVAAAISFTITVSGLFEPLREWVYKKSKFFGQLITCPWCFGHYVVFLIVPICNIPLLDVSKYMLICYFYTSFIIICVMGLLHKALILAYEPVHKMMAQREINRLKEKKLEAELKNL